MIKILTCTTRFCDLSSCKSEVDALTCPIEDTLSYVQAKDIEWESRKLLKPLSEKTTGYIKIAVSNCGKNLIYNLNSNKPKLLGFIRLFPHTHKMSRLRIFKI